MNDPVNENDTRDIDFFNGAVKAEFVKACVTLELTGIDFNQILHMRNKTKNTLQGLDTTVQLTSRPKTLFMEKEKHQTLIGALLKRNIVCVAPDEDKRREAGWSTFAVKTKSVDGAVLFDALTEIGVTKLRLITFGDKVPIASFCTKIGPYLDDAADASFVMDLTSNIVAATAKQRSCVPLIHIKPGTSSRNTATLNLLYDLGTADAAGPSGSVRISCRDNPKLLAGNQRSNPTVQYIMIYPTFTHLLKAIGVPDHMPELPTQERARRLRQKLEACLARFRTQELKDAFEAVLGKYRVEVRCTFVGSGANLCTLLSSSTNTTLADVNRISGIDADVAFVERAELDGLHKRALILLNTKEMLIGRGNRSAPTPDVVVARIGDIINMMGLTVGLFDAIPLSCKQVTFEPRAANDLPNKDDISHSAHVWEPAEQRQEQQNVDPQRRSRIAHVPPLAQPVPANRDNNVNVAARMAEIRNEMHICGGPGGKRFARTSGGTNLMGEATDEEIIKRVWDTYGEGWRDFVLTKERMRQNDADRQRRANEKRKAAPRRARV